MKAISILLIPVILSNAAALAQLAIVTESDRYFELSSNILHEPCLTYEGVSYKAQLLLEDEAEAGFRWALLNGEKISELPDSCESVRLSALTNDPTIPFVSYNTEGVIIAEDGVDTGLRYDIASRADSSRFDLGFNFDRIRERRVEETVVVTGAASVSFPGPSSFPFEISQGADQWIGVDKSFSGALSYDAEANLFTVTFDSANTAGDYNLAVYFDGFGRSNSVGLVLVYPIEFHVF